MRRNTYMLLLFLCLSMLSRKHMYAQDVTPFADENVDDLGDVSDAFQEAFFEALKQKGIENYERAITYIDQCIGMQPSLSILYFERGKNYNALKNYDKAAEDLLKSLDLKPNQEPVLEALYEVYYRNRDYENAEAIVQKLVPFDIQYKEDLARIYMATKRYDQALDMLDELDDQKGSDVYRDQLRERVYALSGNRNRQTQAIEKRIADNPENEDEYLKLIYLYSEQGDTKKAYDAALKLQEVNPESEEVQLALYKFYLEDGKTAEAIASMQKALQSQKIPNKAKHRVLNDFLLFVNKNERYEDELERAIAIFDSQAGDAKIYQELSNYYIGKGLKSKALPYLEKALNKDPENLELIKNTLLLQLDAGDNVAAEKIASEALELYPSQPLLYLTYGAALSNQGKYEQSIEQLEIGIDYIIDNVQMEADFYKQLSTAYTASGDAEKGKQYLEKSQTLKSQIDK